ncbi:hypothetical protein ABS768_04140 [Flavobacterium sp. ST-75]|uniref:Lipoprotein n=1 Tax=Flavobacterium rhizophilum TaxID=3163296 RepID=A0ABW8Y9N8_9FLAO
MKNLFALLMFFSMTIATISCREKNTDIEHHSESGNVDDIEARSPGAYPAPENGGDHSVTLPHTEDTITNNQRNTTPATP